MKERISRSDVLWAWFWAALSVGALVRTVMLRWIDARLEATYGAEEEREP